MNLEDVSRKRWLRRRTLQNSAGYAARSVAVESFVSHTLHPMESYMAKGRGVVPSALDH